MYPFLTCKDHFKYIAHNLELNDKYNAVCTVGSVVDMDV
jgi:hypothetical protein